MPQMFNLSQAVNEMYNMLRHVLGDRIDFQWTPCPDRVWVNMDRTQLDQIVMNLCINARDAMKHAGRIAVKVTRQPWASANGMLGKDIPEGDCACLTVSDTGCGMDEETMGMIFEPFFTTKEQHEGTGLGLASVYGNVKQSGGHIHVDSWPGKGTTFEVYLPLVGK